ncbi:class F sortase (plasmid) [Streptomycetaceae bacterium NBC_01309]
MPRHPEPGVSPASGNGSARPAGPLPPSAPAAAAQPLPAPAGPPAQAVTDAVPTRVRIPALGVDSLLEALEIGPDGHLGTPKDPHRAGWWADGPRPGSPGAAVLVGHVDSRTGPAVFYTLATLRPGARVEVARADGTTAPFTVTKVATYPKGEFPTDAVYGATAGPSLRLLTCGGRYDKRQRAYTDNVVVFADPAPAPAASPRTAAPTARKPASPPAATAATAAPGKPPRQTSPPLPPSAPASSRSRS